jgi:hypothetical protein
MTKDWPVKGQPILAGVLSGEGFQPALAGSEGSPVARESRLKSVPRGDPGQDCPPHNLCRRHATSELSNMERGRPLHGSLNSAA